jgi:Spy/CpxP family protein refolding chaperone
MVRQATGGRGVSPANGAEHDPAAMYIQAGANPEQVETIRGLAKNYESKSSDQARDVIDLLRELHKCSLSPDLDEDKILATQEKINKLQNDMATEKMKLLIAIRKVLTPEQRKELVELMKKRAKIGHGPAPETVR